MLTATVKAHPAGAFHNKAPAQQPPTHQNLNISPNLLALKSIGKYWGGGNNCKKISI